MSAPDVATIFVIANLSRALHQIAMFGPSEEIDGRQYREIRDNVWWLRLHAEPAEMRTLWTYKGRWN